MSDGYFIDGLQTREERSRKNARARSAVAWSNLEKRPARVKDYTTMSGGDPLVARGSAQRPRRIAEEKPVTRRSAPVESRVKTPARRTTEDEYRRHVLGFSDDELDMDLYSDDLYAERRQKAKEERKKSKKKSMKKRVILSVAGVAVVLIGVFYFWGDALISKITGGNAGLFDLFRSAVLADGSAKFKTGDDGRTNILMFGTSGYDMEGTEDDGVHDGAQLTDSIMMLSFNQENGDLAMVSIPRDLLVGTCMATGKINEVYLCGNPYGDDETSGAKDLMKEVSNVLGVQIQYYMHVNWGALVAIVDALGGITVTLDEDIEDDWTKTFIRAGEPTTLNGDRALALARARHGTVGGDFTRARSQQKILIALKERVTEKGLNLVELLNVASVLGDNFRTDFSEDEIAAGAKLATTADFASLRQVSLLDTEEGSFLTTGMINGTSYVLPVAGERNYEEIRRYVGAKLSNAEPAEVAGNILVLNGSGVTGIAAAEREELLQAGFEVKDIGDAPAGDYFGAYYLYDLTGKTSTREKLEKYYNISARGRDELPDEIDTTDVDFVVILGVGYTE